MNPMMKQLSNSNNILHDANIMRSLASGRIDHALIQKVENMPQYRDFLARNKGKTPEQIASEYGINMNDVMRFLK